MIKIPAITTKIANETLAPYFKKIKDDIAACKTNTAKKELLQEYRVYIEGEARKSKSIGARMQLRINMRALQNDLEATPEPEITVSPKQSLCVPLNNRLRLAHIS